MSKTGVFLSSVVYVGASLFTLFSLSSCTQKTKIAKVIPVETSMQTLTSQVPGTSSGPFQLEKKTHSNTTAQQTRAPASVIEE